jgi:three-Cys-motif partner protein
LEAIAATHAIDVWYLFPLGGLIRQAARNPDALDDAKRASLTKTLGTTEWRTAWYGSTPQSNLFGTVPRESRQFDVAQITSWVTTRLARVFPGSVGPRIFYSLKNGHQQTALFALYFLISNPSPAARNLACKMARDIMAKL